MNMVGLAFVTGRHGGLGVVSGIRHLAFAAQLAVVTCLCVSLNTAGSLCSERDELIVCFYADDVFGLVHP